MLVGHLNSTTLDRKAELDGYVETLRVDLKFRLRLIPDEDRRSENSPAYDIFAKSKSSGRDVQVGNAWNKTAMRGAHMGEKFLSLTIDDPSLESPLYVTAFPQNDGQTWDVHWSRPKGGNVSGANQ